MTRPILNKLRPVTVGACVRQPNEIETLKRFKQLCSDNGVSVQSTLLQLIQQHLKEHSAQ